MKQFPVLPMISSQKSFVVPLFLFRGLLPCGWWLPVAEVLLTAGLGGRGLQAREAIGNQGPILEKLGAERQTFFWPTFGFGQMKKKNAFESVWLCFGVNYLIKGQLDDV